MGRPASRVYAAEYAVFGDEKSINLARANEIANVIKARMPFLANVPEITIDSGTHHQSAYYGETNRVVLSPYVTTSTVIHEMAHWAACWSYPSLDVGHAKQWVDLYVYMVDFTLGKPLAIELADMLDFVRPKG